MTVGDWFESEKIDAHFINENFDGSYWESCERFVTDKWETDVEDLSEKQSSWLSKIVDACIEQRIEK